MSAQIMTLFGSLSSSNVDERTSAATSIVLHLTQVESLSAQEGSDVEYTRSDDLNYTLKRLVRGLASPTPGARLGFSIALCEILRRFPQLSPQEVFESILAATPLVGLKASEERDSLFGRLFGIKAIVQSGALFESKPVSPQNPTSKNARERSKVLKSILTELNALVHRAFWISESVGSIIVLDLASQILRPPNSSEGLKCVIEEILTGVKVWTVEQLSLVILLQKHAIKLDWNSILSRNFPDETILSRRNHDKLLNLLMNGDPICSANHSESGVQNSKSLCTTDLAIRPHFIHKILIEASQSARDFELPCFYNQLFERYYFTEESSVSRKSHGFLILSILLTSEIIPNEDKPNFLTSNCLRTLRTHLANKDRLLHKMALSVISTILTLVGQGNPKSSALAKAFACRIRAFSPDFDRDSQHKLLRPLVSRMQASELELWTEELLCAFQEDSPTWSCIHPQFSDPACSPDYPPSEFRQIMLTQLCSIISMRSFTCSAKCLSSILRCLTLCAFFGEVYVNASGRSVTTSEPRPTASSACDAFLTPSVPFSPALRELCKTRLYTCLLDLIEQTRPQSPLQKTKPKFASNIDHLGGFEPLRTVLEILSSPKRNSNLSTARQNVQPISSIRAILSRLRSRAITIESEELKGKKRALLLLLDIVNLMTYEEQDEWLEPLQLVQQLEKDLGTLLSNDAFPEPSRNIEGSASPFANLTKCLLFLLSWPIALLRVVVEINFELFSECMGPESLRLLVDQVNPPVDLPEDDDSQNNCSVTEEDNESSEVGSSVEEESDTDAETTTADGSIDEEFKNDVAMALGHALSKPTESNDASDEESDLMDDDEMLALDANLAAIFKRRNGKKLSRIQSTQDLHLRMKILDLIAKFVQIHPAPSIRGLLIKPLLELINKINPSEMVMREKVLKILGDTTRLPLSNLEPSKPSALLSATDVSDIIRSIHLTAQTSDSVDIAQSCAKCDGWIIEMIQSNANLFVAETERQAAILSLVEIHQQSLKRFCFKRSRFRPDFFSPMFRRLSTFGWLLRHDILDLCINPATLNDYRRQQMLEFILSLIRSYPPKNRLGPGSLQEFDDYLCKIKQSTLSFRTALVPGKVENGLLKDRETALKNLKGLVTIMKNALERRLKMNPTSCSTIWPDDDIEKLSALAKEIPVSSLSGIITKLIEGLIKLVRKSGIDRNGQTLSVLKRKESPSNEGKTLGKSASETQTPQRIAKKKRKKKS